MFNLNSWKAIFFFEFSNAEWNYFSNFAQKLFQTHTFEIKKKKKKVSPNSCSWFSLKCSSLLVTVYKPSLLSSSSSTAGCRAEKRGRGGWERESFNSRRAAASGRSFIATISFHAGCTCWKIRALNFARPGGSTRKFSTLFFFIEIISGVMFGDCYGNFLLIFTTAVKIFSRRNSILKLTFPHSFHNS